PAQSALLPYTTLFRSGHGRPIMRKKDPSPCCRPFQYDWIIRRLESNISDSNEIQIRLAAKKSAQDVGVEIGITGEAEHPHSPGGDRKSTRLNSSHQIS